MPKDDPKKIHSETSKLERLVGRKPKVNFDKGFKRTITGLYQKTQFTE